MKTRMLLPNKLSTPTRFTFYSLFHASIGGIEELDEVRHLRITVTVIL